MEQTRAAKVGAGPRWEPLLLTKNHFYGDVALGNGTQLRCGIFKTFNGELFIGVEEMGAACFQSEVTAKVIFDSLGLDKLADARCLADLINNELGCLGTEQGEYIHQYCRP